MEQGRCGLSNANVIRVIDVDRCIVDILWNFPIEFNGVLQFRCVWVLEGIHINDIDIIVVIWDTVLI